jgi:hypothetical protein
MSARAALSFCGWRLFSAIPLPELLPWSGPADASEISLDLKDMAVPPEGTGPGSVRVTKSSACIVTIPGLVVFRVDPGGHKIAVSCAHGADPLLVRSVFYGTVLAVICYKRDLLPIHGACVRVGDNAIIFSGDSGAGKSTLATALALRGHPLRCDDISPVDWNLPIPKTFSAVRRTKLLSDSIKTFALDEGVVYTRAAQGIKGHFGFAEIRTDPVDVLPVSAIYAVGKPESDRVSRVRMDGRAAVTFLRSQVYRAPVGSCLGKGGAIFSGICSLVSSTPVYRLLRPNDLSRIYETVDFLEEAHL